MVRRREPASERHGVWEEEREGGGREGK